MPRDTTSSARSFRLSLTTADLLDRRATDLGQSRNAVVERLLAEGLRVEDHPLIYFRSNVVGARTPAIVGSRLYVWQVIDALRKTGGNTAHVADDFGLTEQEVQAAANYYADFGSEVDVDAARAAEFTRREKERHQKAALIAR